LARVWGYDPEDQSLTLLHLQTHEGHAITRRSQSNA
jgi:hypothetical protein